MIDLVKAYDELKKLIGETVRVVCNDGDTVLGKISGFTSGDDNDDGVATVDLISDRFPGGAVIVPENEIDRIEAV